jgi:sporulation protein YlmC with PRC-barrel domain
MFGAIPYTPPTAVSGSTPAPADRAGVAAGDFVYPEDVSLPKGAVVFDREGNDVGLVEDVRLDPETGQLMGFVLRIGGMLRTLFGGGDCVEIGRSQVDRVGEGTVSLRIAKDEVEQLAKREHSAR